ncbi:metallophosphoesterase, partial [bacterium]|nr:metallophosphoesterase [bacterium]
TQQLKARDKAIRAANYYLKKNTSLRHGEPMLGDALRDQALVCQAWLTQALAQPFEGQTVVVTHFAPSLGSADPRYGLTPGTAGFCNNLDHRAGCRVVANPLGYARKNEQAHFKAGSCIVL